MSSHEFTPRSAGTTTISVTTSSGATSIDTAADASGFWFITAASGNSVPVFLNLGAAGVTAAVASGFPLLPGHAVKVRVGAGTSHIAAIVASATATIYVSRS